MAINSLSYVVAKFAAATNCPNGFVGQATPTYEFAGPAPTGKTAKADLQKEIDDSLAKFDAEQEPKTDCGQHKCELGACTYDSQIIGTPTVLDIPAGKTHKHGFATPARHQITMTIEFGCWCEKAM